MLAKLVKQLGNGLKVSLHTKVSSCNVVSLGFFVAHRVSLMLIFELSVAICCPEIILTSAQKKKPSEPAEKTSFLFKIISYNQA